MTAAARTGPAASAKLPPAIIRARRDNIESPLLVAFASKNVGANRRRRNYGPKLIAVDWIARRAGFPLAGEVRLTGYRFTQGLWGQPSLDPGRGYPSASPDWKPPRPRLLDPSYRKFRIVWHSGRNRRSCPLPRPRGR